MNQTPSPAAQTDQTELTKKDAATRWRKLLEDQRASGLPITAFCSERGIAASSLFAWRRRLLHGQEIFKPVKLAAALKRRQADDGVANSASEAADMTCLELCLPGQRRLIVHPGFDRQLLVDLIRALESLA